LHRLFDAIFHESLFDTSLRNRAQCEEPLWRGAAGYRYDEGRVAIWTEAIRKLAIDADAKLPSSNGSGRD